MQFGFNKEVSINAVGKWLPLWKYRKIPKISPSMYKPLQTRSAKNPPRNRPSEYKPPGGLYLEIPLKYKAKKSKNGKSPSNYKASLIDFETQISLRR